MHGRFVIRRDGRLETYQDYDSIPESFENVIEFMPHTEPGPHTDAEHRELSDIAVKLAELMQRETNASSD